jgi:trehalose/maltose transport system permease protein
MNLEKLNLRQLAGRVVFWFGLGVLLFYLLFPFYWAIVSSLKTSNQLFATPISYVPQTPQWVNYVSIFTTQPFGRFLFNSLLVAGGTTLLSLLFGVFAAYAIGRFQFRGRQPIYYAMLAVTMFPQISVRYDPRFDFQLFAVHPAVYDLDFNQFCPRNSQRTRGSRFY